MEGGAREGGGRKGEQRVQKRSGEFTRTHVA